MPLKLFEHPLSPYARKVKIVLYEKEIPFDPVFIQPLTIRRDDPEFRAFAEASLRLEVPSLVDGDFRCHDSTIIVDYIDEKWPDRPMLPPDPAGRARARMIEDLCDTSVDAILWGMMEIQFFRRAEGALAERITENARQQLGRIWDHLDGQLLANPWFSGGQFGRADASAIVHVVSAEFFGMQPLERHARLREWSARCLDVASVKRDQADLASFMARDGLGAMRKGPIRRQYRDHRLEWIARSGGIDVVLRGIELDTIQFSAFP